MKIFSLIVLGYLVYLIGWPSLIEPEKWHPSTVNQEINKSAKPFSELILIPIEDGKGAEDVSVDQDGFIYAGLDSGKVMKIDPNPPFENNIFTQTKGRPLGLDMGEDSHLIVADSDKGLLKIDTKGHFIVLTDKADGVPFAFTDDVDIAKDGMIYFTDASFKFGQKDYKLDALEHGPNGRFLSYNPKTKETKVLLKNLYFPNGVAVSENQEFVLLNETWNYRVLRYWLKGPDKGKVEAFIENLPGFPDGISTGLGGLFWLALPAPRDFLLDKLAAYPFIRKILSKLPKFLHPKAKKHLQILGLSSDGKIIHNFIDRAPRSFYMITSVEEKNGYLYLGSLESKYLAKMKLPPTKNLRIN